MADTLNAIEEYFRINIEKKLLIHFPEEDEHQLTTGTRLLEVRRQMQEVDQGLAVQKEEYESKMDSVEQRRLDLNRKQKQLKDSLEKFDKFLKENDAKKIRAFKKTIEERKIREQKETEIAKLKESMIQLNNRKEKQTFILDRDLRYQHFLEYVLETFQDFDEIKDLVSRYETLVATNHDLLERSIISSDQMELERKKLSALIESKMKNNAVLSYNNDLARLQTKYESLQQYNAFLDASFDQKIEVSTQKTLLAGRIKLATNNLFSLVKNHFSSRLGTSTDTVTQLKKIQQAVVDLTEITKEMNEKGEKLNK